MKHAISIAATAAASFFATSHARAVTPQEEALLLIARAAPANQPHGYTPQTVTCPSAAPTVRAASGLSENENAWLEVRRNATVDPMRDLLGRMNITGLDTDAYIDKHKSNASALPNIGIALSGGGYRAMLTAAGIVEAFDSRTTNATSPGQLGGLLQSATYVAGLSGGSWLVGSLYANNFTSVDSILAMDTDKSGSGGIWQLDQTIFEGPDSGGIQLLSSLGYFSSIVDSVQSKNDAGQNTTLTDYWGRALSYQLINATDGGPAYTWSSIAQQDWFTSGSAPMPVIVADSRAPGETLVSSNSTIYTFDPFEFGSNDPTVYAFMPLQYLGGNFSDGSPRDTNECVVGFDNVGFVFGTSSSLFNAIITTVNGTNATSWTSSIVQKAIVDILADIGQDNEDIADYPNPFYHYNNGSNRNAQSDTLTLVDGGEDGQNIPFYPLIQPDRQVDVIFALDSSADSNATLPTTTSATGWPDGVSIVTTYERSLSDIGNGTVFPAVPDINTFFNLGLNNRPTFFGCDASNLSAPAPLVVYLPNAPYVYNSNTSTFDLQYNNTERNAVVLNAYNLATQGNSSLDHQWPACIGCAILSRSLNRTGTAVPEICTQCFDRYCWNGTTDSRAPSSYVPAMKLPNSVVSVKSSAVGSTVSLALALVVAAATGFLVM